MQFSTPIIGALVGVVILFFGRKLFWLCVAAVGFAAGVELVPHFSQQPSPWLALTFAIVLGFVGALLALFLQKVAVAIAGFLSGGKLAAATGAAFFAGAEQHFWLLFLIGGIVGAILLLIVFDWALIFLSSVIGAHLVQSIFVLPPNGSAILFVVLVVSGVAIQATTYRRSRVAMAG
jgi:hypothetical protein